METSLPVCFEHIVTMAVCASCAETPTEVSSSCCLGFGMLTVAKSLAAVFAFQ